jgi:tRNA threonylcarbamoyl adenosine modification protein YjeE
MEYTAATEEDTIKIAQGFASEIRDNDVITLHGNLGMGKSVFARALIRELAGDPKLDVPSPTFTLVQLYDTPKAPIAHFDLYRLEDPEEILELGWEDTLADGITIVEWPDRLGPYMPRMRVDIHLQAGDNDAHTRKILIERISA